MTDPERRRQIREAMGLTHHQLAFLFGVGVATTYRWERRGPKGTRPTGLSLQMYEMLHLLMENDIDIAGVREQLLARGSLGALRWILNAYFTMKGWA